MLKFPWENYFEKVEKVEALQWVENLFLYLRTFPYLYQEDLSFPLQTQACNVIEQSLWGGDIVHTLLLEKLKQKIIRSEVNYETIIPLNASYIMTAKFTHKSVFMRGLK